jgi:predicted DNA-binding protein YlxM (UPF0122 family)
MIDLLRETLLYDFYSELLTEKQKRFFDLRYLQDFSLAEIAQEESVSPQAVADLLKRTNKILTRYEESLRLVQKYQAQKKQLTQLIDSQESILLDMDNELPSTKALLETVEQLKCFADLL